MDLTWNSLLRDGKWRIKWKVYFIFGLRADILPKSKKQLKRSPLPFKLVPEFVQQ